MVINNPCNNTNFWLHACNHSFYLNKKMCYNIWHIFCFGWTRFLLQMSTYINLLVFPLSNTTLVLFSTNPLEQLKCLVMWSIIDGEWKQIWADNKIVIKLHVTSTLHQVGASSASKHHLNSQVLICADKIIFHKKYCFGAYIIGCAWIICTITLNKELVCSISSRMVRIDTDIKFW